MDVRPDDSQGSGLAARPELQLEPIVSLILRSGVAAATVLMLMGTLITFARHPDYRSSPDALKALLAPESLRSPDVLLASLPEFRGQAFVLVGLLILIATPMVRVAVTASLLWNHGERRLGLFGAGVLLLLLVSFGLGHAI